MQDVGLLDDIPVAGARTVKAGAFDIAVFRTTGGKVFALVDRCPHRAGPLSQGIVHGEQVTCPLHNWVIDLASGEVVGPDAGCSQTIPVRVEDGRVHLDLTVLIDEAA